MSDDYLSLSGPQRRELLDQALMLYGARCWLCRLPIKAGDESLDHVVPRSKGGTSAMANLRPAHKRCNSARGARDVSVTVHDDAAWWLSTPLEPEPEALDVERAVVLLCGPPGAGKTTTALSLQEGEGLTPYDSDDPQWGGYTKEFERALDALGRDDSARAVVIVSGATRSARSRAAQRIRATEVHVLIEPRDELERRVKQRNRKTQPLRTQLAAIGDWFDRYEPD